MLIRKHKQSDIPSISRLYYDTIHLVNRWDYTEEQLNAWAPRIYDDPSLSAMVVRETFNLR